MEREELVYWLKRYDFRDPPASKATEEKLTQKFQKNGFATKEDLVELLKWKFSTMKGRLIRELNLLNEQTDKQIIEITKRAFQCDDELEKIEILKSINGFGNAVCSVALTFHDPNTYCVFDIHAWRGLFGEQLKDDDSTKSLIKFLEEVRKIAKQNNMTCREVEKAIFQKDLEESKNKKKQA